MRGCSEGQRGKAWALRGTHRQECSQCAEEKEQVEKEEPEHSLSACFMQNAVLVPRQWWW